MNKLVIIGLSLAMLATGCGSGSTRVNDTVAGSPSPSPEVSVEPTPTVELTPTPQSTSLPTPKPTPRPSPLPPKDSDGRAAATAPEGLVLTLSLERTTYRHPQTIDGTLKAENRSDHEIAFTHPNNRRVFSGLYDWQGSFVGGRGGVVGRSPTLVPNNIPAGDSQTWQVTFTALARRQNDGTQDKLPPGSYQAAAAVETTDGPWFAPAIIVTIQ